MFLGRLYTTAAPHKAGSIPARVSEGWCDGRPVRFRLESAVGNNPRLISGETTLPAARRLKR